MQKTAYEMRISDWSSDVCSSDLRCSERGASYNQRDAWRPPHFAAARKQKKEDPDRRRARKSVRVRRESLVGEATGASRTRGLALLRRFGFPVFADVTVAHVLSRSEEHTSELPSLMRISYALFCLKK